jgi:hypothetical protein
MPHKRIIYTLGDVKELLSKKHRIDISYVNIFHNEILSISMSGSYAEQITDDHFIFEITDVKA